MWVCFSKVKTRGGCHYALVSLIGSSDRLDPQDHVLGRWIIGGALAIEIWLKDAEHYNKFCLGLVRVSIHGCLNKGYLSRMQEYLIRK